MASEWNEVDQQITPGYIPADTNPHETIRRQADIIKTLQATIDSLTDKLDQTITRLVESEARRLADNNTHLATIRDLQTRISELEAKTKRNSKNSSQPPSTDGLTRPNPQSLRPKNTGRKTGGQPGHPGTTLLQTDRPDDVIVCHPDHCDHCLQDLQDIPANRYQRRQVIDLPPLHVTWTEYQIDHVTCPHCHHTTQATAPDGVRRQIQYGPNLLALVCYLYQCGIMSLERVQQFAQEAFGTTISQQVIINASRHASTRLQTVFQPLAHQALIDADVVHADETGFRINGKLAWLHSASNPDWTWIEPHSKRGLEALRDIAILIVFSGVLVHDCWSAYDSPKLEKLVYHQLCCAHLLRELAAVTEYWIGQGKDPKLDTIWSLQASLAIQSIIHDTSTLADNRSRFIHAAMTALNHSTFPPGKLGQKHRALARRIHHRPDDYLYFASHSNVPPTNNPAEQEIRMAKVRQKVSGGMRTIQGTKDFTTIKSYTATARKRGITAYHAIRSLFTPTPWLPTLTATP